MKRKVLYENKIYADNYTDEDTFLSGLQKNIGFQESSLLQAIKGATLLVQQICTVIIFILFYVYLYNEWADPQKLFYCSSCVTIIGYVIYKIGFRAESESKLGNDLRTVLIFIVFGHLFSPVLYTLTVTISTDTIYTMSFLMILVHLIFFNYGISAAIVSNNLSLNAAVFASVCLASRLSSAYHAFVLLSIAIKCFVLFPLLKAKLKNSWLFTGILVLLVTYSLILVSPFVTILFILSLIFITIVCPIMYVHNQKYKENIYGPWDEAIVDDTDSMKDFIYCN